MRAYFCILGVAVSANSCSIVQECCSRNYMAEEGNLSYLLTPQNASYVLVCGGSNLCDVVM